MGEGSQHIADVICVSSLSVSVALVRLELPDVLVAGVPPARPPELTEALLHAVNVVPLEPVTKFASH